MHIEHHLPKNSNVELFVLYRTAYFCRISGDILDKMDAENQIYTYKLDEKIGTNLLYLFIMKNSFTHSLRDSI